MGACVYVVKPALGLAKVLMIVFFFMSVYTVVTIYNLRKEIMDNWEDYKCNPLVTPFSELFGRSSVQTRNQCVEYSYMSNSTFLVNPMTNIFDKVALGFGDILGIVGDVNLLTVNIRDMFTSGFVALLRYLQNVASTMQYLIYKIQTLMQRMMAVMMVLLKTTQMLIVGLTKIQDSPKMKCLGEKVKSAKNMMNPKKC